ncbi:short transient receptor potential channel 5-like [Saccoglossus kowalevskii]|uniref:Short transient receptor potential channel 5-like n=1 Tax=Saccoglossus kowalevskii TaxID=10224 RepID=A0ABM0LXG0_SACKO|nr:PREDICTED: short transient receptor potential channel 5-like [Saccoglossus kowalevskii]
MADEEDIGKLLIEAVLRSDANAAVQLLTERGVNTDLRLERNGLIKPILQLAAENNDYAMVKLLLEHGSPLLSNPAFPGGFKEDILTGRTRIDVYKSLCSPPYIIFTKDDPLTRVFELCKEMSKLMNSHAVKNTSKIYYSTLVQQLKLFAVEILECCYNSEEVSILLKGKPCKNRPLSNILDVDQYHLAVRAIESDQKEFIGHYYSQDVLKNGWEMGQPTWSQRDGVWWSILYWSYCIMVFGVLQIPFGIIYIFAPCCPISQLINNPKGRFIMRAFAHAVFLISMIVFDLLHSLDPTVDVDLMFYIAISVIFIWILALLYEEVLQCYQIGTHNYFSDIVNIFDIVIKMSFLAITCIQAKFVGTATYRYTILPVFIDCWYSIICVFACIRYMENLFLVEFVGPMLFHFSNMATDVARFICIFLIVCITFVFGLYNLYNDTGTDGSFTSLETTITSLLGSVFGSTVSDSSLEVSLEFNVSAKFNQDASEVYSTLGFTLYAVFCLISILVLVNLCIAMMSDTYARLQERVDIEWKFKRTKMWLHYFSAPTLPPPLNLIPTGYCLVQMCLRVCSFRRSPRGNKRTASNTNSAKQQTDGLTYDKVIQVLVDRYLYKINPALNRRYNKTGILNPSTKKSCTDYTNYLCDIEDENNV